MSREHRRINRFGFAEYEDMIELSRETDGPELARVLSSIVERVLSEESGLLETLSDGAQADFVVPLGMAARMLSSGGYSAMELVSAAAAVRYCAEPHRTEFPDDLARMLSRLPR
ncbi:hypothetical protein [Spongiactinospora sp. TRM90649]|uniref:hypothetical protein n=1 Tax=Spongiactinospora sp. TRM90649 TaxID=3031114 RepID=UPI0023F6602C|nr:hypothetical protein [Spongiactinospora sp. TRM90649]MDF5751878.1 hypothetical protein [Spongiactinospora sp. TRM90649]